MCICDKNYTEFYARKLSFCAPARLHKQQRYRLEQKRRTDRQTVVRQVRLERWRAGVCGKQGKGDVRMEDPMIDISTELVVTETVQINGEKESVVSLVSNYISDFQNWWWLLGVCLVSLFIVIYLFWNKQRINELSEKKLQEFKQNKKYMPLLFVELSNIKELLRYFVYSSKWRGKIISNFNRLYKGKKLFRNYSKKYIKQYKLSFWSSLETIQRLIDKHISYF